MSTKSTYRRNKYSVSYLPLNQVPLQQVPVQAKDSENGATFFAHTGTRYKYRSRSVVRVQVRGAVRNVFPSNQPVF